MGDIAKTISKVANLDSAIENALENEVADVIKNYLVESAYQNVYETYTPEFYSRRFGDGGILDTRSIKITVSGNELIASDDADWQNLWGDNSYHPAKRLAQAIADGDPRFNMDKAGPRPFHEDAKRAAIESGEIERALKAGLARQGIDASDYTFKFI